MTSSWAATRFVIVMLTAVSGCSDDSGPTLLVDLRTDYAPEVEFERVRIEVMADPGGIGAFVVHDATTAEDYIEGTRVGRLTGLDAGDIALRVDLIRSDGTVLASRPASVQLAGRLAITVVVTRSCEAVVCPGPSDPAELAACVSGGCVDPACVTGAEESCAPPECAVAGDCSGASDCTTAVCGDGVCLVAIDPIACGAGMVCDPSTGCRAMDPDAGPGDAGVDAAMDVTPDVVPDTGPDAAPDPIASPLFYIDAADSNGAGAAGSADCPAAGAPAWVDLVSGTPAVLTDFAATACGRGGWAGDGSLSEPHRLNYDATTNPILHFGAIGATRLFTVEAWVRYTGLGLAIRTGSDGIFLVPIVAKGSAEIESADVDVNYFLGITMTGVLGFDFEDMASSSNHPIFAPSAFAMGEWHHMAASYDEMMIRLYVDNELVVSRAESSTPSNAANSNLAIGSAVESDASPDPGKFDGDIAIVRVFDRALDPAEIRTECLAFAGRFGITCAP